MQGSAAASFKFTADVPTITMARLKALLTGGMPTFLDIGDSFSASAVNEDNLLERLAAEGWRMVRERYHSEKCGPPSCSRVHSLSPSEVFGLLTHAPCPSLSGI